MSGTALYKKLLAELDGFKEQSYADFQSRLLNGDFKVLGVRVPLLRKLAKKYYPHIDEVLAFPDEYYEVKFIKLTCASMLDYARFTEVVDGCVALIDNWALCDCFSAKCIKANREDFLKYIKKYLAEDGEFYKRYALTTLLYFYVDEEYLGLILNSLKSVDTRRYYVHMAAAWLTAEIIIKHYDIGVVFLKEGALDKKTHNKAIQKSCESYRLDKERKNFLRTLKR